MGRIARVVAGGMPHHVTQRGSRRQETFFGEDDYRAYLELMTTSRPRPPARKAGTTAEEAKTISCPRILPGDPRALYEQLYCQRGDAENRIKEQQLGLFADRTSCHGFGANQFRVLLSPAAYVLMETLRRVGLAGTELATAQATTIRLKLLKIGGRVVRSVRRLVIHLASGFPLQRTFETVLRQLRDWRCVPGPSP